MVIDSVLDLEAEVRSVRNFYVARCVRNMSGISYEYYLYRIRIAKPLVDESADNFQNEWIDLLVDYLRPSIKSTADIKYMRKVLEQFWSLAIHDEYKKYEEYGYIEYIDDTLSGYSSGNYTILRAYELNLALNNSYRYRENNLESKLSRDERIYTIYVLNHLDEEVVNQYNASLDELAWCVYMDEQTKLGIPYDREGQAFRDYSSKKIKPYRHYSRLVEQMGLDELYTLFGGKIIKISRWLDAPLEYVRLNGLAGYLESDKVLERADEIEDEIKRVVFIRHQLCVNTLYRIYAGDISPDWKHYIALYNEDIKPAKKHSKHLKKVEFLG